MMTNEELYKDEAEKIAKEDNTYHPAVYKGKPVSCIGISCYKCDLYKPQHKGCSDLYIDWLKSEAEPEKSEPEKKEKKMKKGKIKVGDTVKVTKKSCAEEGKIGLVIELFSISADGVKTYRVRFNGTFSECVFFENELEKVKTKKTQPRIVIYRDGDTVTARDLETGETASAVCSKDDTFDFHTGAFIAMSRLTHFDTDIRLMRLKMEHLDSCISDIKMGFGALMGEGYKYPDFDEEEEA